MDQFSIIAPAFVAGAIILLSHVLLGREVLNRGIIFIDLAIAQVAGLGIIVASVLDFDAHGWELQAIALTSAILGAALLSVVEKRAGQYQEAIIGCVFILSATASILLLAHDPHGGEQLKDMLVGQILWVEWQQLIFPAIINTVVLILWFKAVHLFQGRLFYFFFAISITVSVQVVGVYLVFASLILPALATIKQSGRSAVLFAYMIGLCGYALGLLLSAVYDLPAGAVIVWAIFLVVIAFTGFKSINKN